MIASLMMYARPELDAANARYWSMVREELAKQGIDSPSSLSNSAEEFMVWTNPDLVLSQTCGMPYRLWLHDKAALVGTPDYGLEGCPPGYYRSAIVVRRDDVRDSLSAFADATFAYNVTFSQSGFASIYNTLAPLEFWFENRVETGGHLASARAVADGRADIAALDGVTWKLIQRYEPFAADLRVLQWTTPTPGLPYVTAKGQDAEPIFHAVSAAIDRLEHTDRDALMLRGIVQIPKQVYLDIPNPPEATRSQPAFRNDAI